MPRFTTGEMRVMRLLWEHGELKPAQLQQLFPEPIKNPALRSYLTILVDKGHVSRRRVGKVFFYRAKTQRQRAFWTMLGDLVTTFCAGSVENLVMTLVRKERLSDEDLRELRRLVDQSVSRTDADRTGASAKPPLDRVAKKRSKKRKTS